MYLTDIQTRGDIESVIKKISNVFYILAVIFGIPGNSAVICMAGFKLKKNVTNVWLVNLAIADLIFCFTRLLSIINKLFYDHWPFGVLFCKFNSFFKYANMFCSVFLLAVISIDRMLCIWKPVFTKRHRSLFVARVVAVIVWITAVLFSSPHFIYRQLYMDENKTKCSIRDEAMAGDKSTKYALINIRFMCGFLLPFIVILVCYIVAGFGIRRIRLSKKSRTLRILASLVIAFFLCWAPYHCLKLVDEVDSENTGLKVWLPLAKGFAYFNSCINPLLYFCMGLNVRGGLRQNLDIYRRALGENVDGEAAHSNDCSLETRCTAKYGSAVAAGRTRV
ncbi:C3a anaphylatoxin chemotactic receptor-like [Kryptolebias marmoratus]|nr:C3a anaphylatoxin chemotactic receptor-like [Kryptolebias marmoratus]